ANLDTANSAQAMDIMQKLNEETGTAFVFATHDPQVMSYAKRIIKMQDGRIVDDGLQISSTVSQAEVEGYPIKNYRFP
ncbi:MAG: hypothetical protein AB8G95_24815, partial [Anaerolineae bacterium]